MKKRAAKAAVLLIEIFAIGVAVFAAGAAYLFIRLQQGPVALGAFNASAVFAIERRLPKGYDAAIGEIDIVKNENLFRLRLKNLELTDAVGDSAATADLVEFVFAAGDFADRSIGPRTVEATGARFRVVRNTEQSLKVPAARGRGGRSLFPSSDKMIGDGFLRSAFQKAEMRDAVITFVDEASGRAWTSDNASVAIDRTEDGLVAALAGDIDLDGASAYLQADAQYKEMDGVIALNIAGKNFPIGDLLTMFYGDEAAVIDALASGEGAIELTRDGKVRSSTFQAKIGAGALKLGGADAPINFIEWETGFDPAANRFTIDRFDYDVAGNRGAAKGAVALEFGDDVRDPERVLFDLDVSDILIALPDRLPAPLPMSSAHFVGDYDVGARQLDLSAFSLDLLDIAINGAFSFAMPRENETGGRASPGVTADLKVDGALDPARLLRIWPLGVGMGARDWIEGRMETARIANITAIMNLAPGAIDADGLMPDDALAVSFDVTGGKAFYAAQMTPVTSASGSGVLRGNSFSLKVDTARVGDVKISDGTVDIPLFIPKWEPTYYRFLATGRSETMLGVLDEAPLNLLSKTNLSPDQFSSDAKARIEIMRPNKREVAPDEYEYRGEATFENMAISGFGADDSELTNGKGTVSLKPRSLTVKGDALLAETPLNLVWKKNFFAEDGPSEITLAGNVDASVGDFFGLSLRNLFGGTVDATARIVGEIGDFETMQFNGDFANAWVRLGLFDWEKTVGAPATGEIAIRFGEHGVAFERVQIDGEGVAISGVATFADGVLSEASIPKFYLDGAADLSFAARRNSQGALDVTATGAYFNAGPAVLQFTRGQGRPTDDGEDTNPWGAGIAATARVDKLELRKKVVYQDASFDLRRGVDALEALNFTALNADGAPLRVNMAETGNETGPAKRIDVRSSDLGGFLKGVFGLQSVIGGQGSMALYYGGDTTGLAGEIEARKMHVVNAPLLARLFSAGSLDGLANLMQGEGIDLSYAYGEFDYGGGALSLRDFRATGPSVGMTAEGEVSLAQDGAIALNGAVAPLYQLNSVLGAAPIIGDILVGRKGEGILALSYSVSGERSAPNVVINPLSALTPGIFRQLLEPAKAPPETGPPPTDVEPIPVEASQSE